MALSGHDNLGHALRAADSLLDAASLGASHRPAAARQATLPNSRVQLRSTQPSARQAARLKRVPPPCGYGFAASYLCWLQASRGRLPRGFVLGGSHHRSLVFAYVPGYSSRSVAQRRRACLPCS